MDPLLQKAFDRLEKQRKSILDTLSEVPREKYHFRPKNKWSVGQILTHLLTSERMALRYMKKKSLGIASAGDSGYLESFQLGLIILAQRIPLKYKAPEEFLINTPEELNFEELVEQWTQARSELRTFAEGISDENVNKKIFKHLWFGRFNIVQGLTFFFEHIRHHSPQIKRLLQMNTIPHRNSLF